MNTEEMSEGRASIEKALERLDEIVKLLERGDVTLDEAMDMFEEGTALVGECTEILEEAEQVAAKLRKGENGEPEELPFDSEE